MRAIKISIFFLAIALLGITTASANNVQCNNAVESCGTTYSKSPTQTRERITTRRVSHNSQDASYANQKIRYSAPARASGPRSMQQEHFNPKDGSMFGGDCSSGKCNKNGTSIFGGPCTKAVKGQCFRACKQNCSSPVKQSCERACKPCFSCKPAIESITDKEKTYKSGFVQNYVVRAENEVYDAIHKCKDLASIDLKHVDFRIKNSQREIGYSNKLGNYRFRIFGCRRFDKKALLNQGRIVQKDLQFTRIFNDMVSDCYNVVKTPNDLCDPENKKPLPEYTLTAEITDYFMNICDKYDWDSAKKEELRTGSSEMTVTWRIMNVTGTEVLWKGESTGYAEIDEGEYNGEIVLLERAFADAVMSLRGTPGFDEQLAKRVSEKDLAKQRQELIELEKIANPIKCEFQEEIKIAEKECEIKRICQDIDTCTGNVVREIITEKEVLVIEKDKSSIDEASGGKATGKFINEDGGSSSTASVNKREEIITIDENSGHSAYGSEGVDRTTIVIIDEDSGHSSSGSGGLNDGSHTTITEVIIDENSGLYSSGSGGLDDGSQTTITEVIIDENSGLYSSGSGSMEDGSQITITESMIDENSGLYSSGSGGLDDTISFEIVDSIIDENSGSFSSGSEFDDELWIEVPLDKSGSQTTFEVREAIEKDFSDSSDNLCIVDRPPYDKLSPENVYKVRASIISITNVNGKKGSGLIISDQFVLTSADLITRNHNYYDLETINGIKLKASAFRINPNKNIALLVLDEKTRYTPLSLNLDLPEVGKNGFLTLGLLDFNQAEGRLENKAKVVGYRFSDERNSEIIISTNIQRASVGGALIDQYGTINGIAHTEKTTMDNNDLFMPISNAIKSVGLSICDKPFPVQTPWYERSTTPISKAIDSYKAPKAPEAMKKKERK